MATAASEMATAASEEHNPSETKVEKGPNSAPSLSALCLLAYSTPYWRTFLAHDVGVSSRTIYRWEKGITPIPAGVWVHLGKLLREQLASIPVRDRELRESLAYINTLKGQ